MFNLYGKKVFLDNQNSISLLEKLKKNYRDVSMLESVIGGDNKGRFTIIFFNSMEEIKIYKNYAIKNGIKKKFQLHKDYIEKIYNDIHGK